MNPAGNVHSPKTGFDGAFTQQNLIFPDRDAASDDIRILIEDFTARITDMTRAIVALGNTPDHALGAATTAVVHSLFARIE